MARANTRVAAGNRLAIFFEIFIRSSLLLRKLSVSSRNVTRRQNLTVAGGVTAHLNKTSPSMLSILAALLACHYSLFGYRRSTLRPDRVAHVATELCGFALA